jgi:hypothetical protein
MDTAALQGEVLDLLEDAQCTVIETQQSGVNQIE